MFTARSRLLERLIFKLIYFNFTPGGCHSPDVIPVENYKLQQKFTAKSTLREYSKPDDTRGVEV